MPRMATAITIHVVAGSRAAGGAVISRRMGSMNGRLRLRCQIPELVRQLSAHPALRLAWMQAERRSARSEPALARHENPVHRLLQDVTDAIHLGVRHLTEERQCERARRHVLAHRVVPALVAE